MTLTLRAKLLVERSKLGLLGRTITLEQAKEMITKNMGEQPDTTPKELKVKQDLSLTEKTH